MEVTICGVPLQCSLELLILINNCDPTTNTTYIKESIVAPVLIIPDGTGWSFSIN